jgi:DNA-binding IclR family transcriptional regulator
MERAVRVKERASEMIEEGQKPSAERISQETGMSIHDVHRCLNHLERNGEVETYTKESLGQKMRMIGIKRT